MMAIKPPKVTVRDILFLLFGAGIGCNIELVGLLV